MGVSKGRGGNTVAATKQGPLSLSVILKNIVSQGERARIPSKGSTHGHKPLHSLF